MTNDGIDGEVLSAVAELIAFMLDEDIIIVWPYRLTEKSVGVVLLADDGITVGREAMQPTALRTGVVQSPQSSNVDVIEMLFDSMLRPTIDYAASSDYDGLGVRPFDGEIVEADVGEVPWFRQQQANQWRVQPERQPVTTCQMSQYTPSANSPQRKMLRR